MKVEVIGFEQLKEYYLDCLIFSPIIQSLEKGPKEKTKDYLLVDNLLFYDQRLCIPHTSLNDFLIWEVHAGGLSDHFGRDKTITSISYQFFWPTLKQDITNIVPQ